MKYKLKPDITNDMLNQFYFMDGRRGASMGWAHEVNSNREIVFCDEEYATKYDEIGGLETFIADLIEIGYVVKEGD